MEQVTKTQQEKLMTVNQKKFSMDDILQERFNRLISRKLRKIDYHTGRLHKQLKLKFLYRKNIKTCNVFENKKNELGIRKTSQIYQHRNTGGQCSQIKRLFYMRLKQLKRELNIPQNYNNEQRLNRKILNFNDKLNMTKEERIKQCKQEEKQFFRRIQEMKDDLNKLGCNESSIKQRWIKKRVDCTMPRL